MHIIFDVLKDTLTITCLVMIMMLLIEFINVSSAGKWMAGLSHRPFLQILLATVLGLIPGCIGGFAIVSLFTHNLVSFGALLAGMIATFGDESFVMLAYSPKWTLILSALLAGIAIVAGVITHFIFRKKKFVLEAHSFEVHENHEGHDHHDHHDHSHTNAHLSFKNLKNISFPRALLVFGLALYILAIVTGVFSHEHGALPGMDYAHQQGTEAHADHHEGLEAESTCTLHECEHSHGQVDEACCAHQHGEAEVHGHEHGHNEGEDHHHHHWENTLFLILAAITLIVVALSSEHFLQSHLWEHVIKHHFLSVFLWSFGVLLFLKLLYMFVDVNALFTDNQWAIWAVMVAAVIIGIIPESGPHLIFLIMFFSGAIPFSVLLANSIVQDGHGALPLLAQSRRNFFIMKGISMLIGLVAGAAGILLGF